MSNQHLIKFVADYSRMSNQKKIMLLGGIHYLLPVIKAAQAQN